MNRMDWDSDETVGDITRLECGCMTFVIDRDHEILTMETDIDVRDAEKTRAFCAAVKQLFNEMEML